MPFDDELQSQILNPLKKSINITLLLFLNFLCGFAQDTYVNYIKTIQVKESKNGNQNNMARLGSSLYFSFDDLLGNQNNYYYKVEHMTHDWKPSRLLSSQYINGFQKNIILNIENSFNTFQNFSHYNFTIPNRNTVLTKSGNYLISVLNDDDEVMFTRQVTFYEPITTVGVSVSRSRQANLSNREQTVQFLVNHPTIKLNFPDREIHVVVLQNQNWRTHLAGIRPQFFKPNQLVYKYVNKTNFLGGNEYLNFDTKIIQNRGINIQRVIRKDIFYSYLNPTQSRYAKSYIFNPDINGQFVIRTLEGNDPNVEADYALMHFSLIPSPQERNLDVYIYGGFNNFVLNEANRMTYNPSTKSFEAAILLKQGFYNYTFVAKDNNDDVNAGVIMGNFSQTENRYDVLVYYKPVGGLYDRAVGLGTIVFKGEQ